jgi:hypothetical protein
LRLVRRWRCLRSHDSAHRSRGPSTTVGVSSRSPRRRCRHRSRAGQRPGR